MKVSSGFRLYRVRKYRLFRPDMATTPTPTPTTTPRRHQAAPGSTNAALVSHHAEVLEAFTYVGTVIADTPRCETCSGAGETYSSSSTPPALAWYAPNTGDAATRCREHTPNDWRVAARLMCCHVVDGVRCPFPARFGEKLLRPTLCEKHHLSSGDAEARSRRRVVLGPCVMCRERQATHGAAPHLPTHCGVCATAAAYAGMPLQWAIGAVCDGYGSGTSCSGTYNTCSKTKKESDYQKARAHHWRTPTYGIEGNKAVRCEGHKRPGDVRVMALRECVGEQGRCGRRALFATLGSRTPLRCFAHRTADDVNVRTVARCVECRTQKVWGGAGSSTCKGCNSALIGNVKSARERSVGLALLAGAARFPALARFAWDQPIMGATYCSCRPDMHYVFERRHVIVECDEQQHATTPAYKTDQRNSDLMHALNYTGVKNAWQRKQVIMVRYNPDEFRVDGVLHGDESVPRDYRLDALVRLVGWLSTADNVEVEWYGALATTFQTKHVTYARGTGLAKPHAQFQLFYDYKTAASTTVADDGADSDYGLCFEEPPVTTRRRAPKRMRRANSTVITAEAAATKGNA